MLYKLILILALPLLHLSSKPGRACSPVDNRDTFYVLIPRFLKDGKISVNKSVQRTPNSTTYIFTFNRTSAHFLEDAAYYLDVQRKRENSRRPIVFKELSAYDLMDSLRVHGRQFFRGNVFYAVFAKEEKKYYYRMTGEFIYADYRKEGDGE